MLYENVYYMVFTSHSAGKIQPSIYIQYNYVQGIVYFTLSD